MSEQELPGPRGASVSLDGAVAVVTGASSGIGQAIAHELHARGSRVVVSSRSVERVQAVADQLDGLAVACDVGSYDQVQRLVAAAVDWGGKLTVMVNNAGLGAFGLLHEIDPGSGRGDDPHQRAGRDLRHARRRRAADAPAKRRRHRQHLLDRRRVPRPRRRRLRGQQGRGRPAVAHRVPRAAQTTGSTWST